MRYLITLTMGTGYDRYNAAIPFRALVDALENIRGKLIEAVGGYTEHTTLGGWEGPDGIVEEPSRQFQALTEEIDSLMEVDKLARHLASFAAMALNQASVMYTFTPVTAGFVGPNEA